MPLGGRVKKENFTVASPENVFAFLTVVNSQSLSKGDEAACLGKLAGRLPQVVMQHV